MSHDHHAIHHAARAAQWGASPAVSTKIVINTVTAAAPAPVPSGWSQSQPIQPTFEVGPPVAATRSAPAPVAQPTHHVPVRHQRPPQKPEPNPSYHAPVRHQRPVQKPKPNPTYHAPVRHQRPTTTAHQGVITPPHSIHHQVGQPIIHDHLTTPASTSHTGIPYSGEASKHSSDQAHGSVSSDSGMSTGAKAGIAIGLVLAIGLLFGLALFFWRKKKNANESHQPLDDEKTGLQKSASVSSHVSVRRTVANAPRLSLRPVTEMFPPSEKQENAAASNMIANSAATARARTPEPPKHLDDKSNPFGDHAEPANTIEESNVTAPAAIVPKPLSIKSERTGTGISESSLSGENQTAPSGAPGSNQQNSRRMSPPGPGPNNVHRVQLDFNPSMDDELGLRAGQLVRMLHEYDDGWALCVRLDRSQQGVVPRTCLSKLPVKPRPQGPPQGVRGPPQGRPRGPPPGPNGPAGGPRMPPNGRLRSQSNSPRQPRPQSPGPMNGPMGGVPHQRPRANSDAMSARRVTPPNMTSLSPTATSPTQGAGVPSRKPVPGQAM